MFPSFPFPFAGVVVRLRLLHCAYVATTVGPASDTSSEGTNSNALDALLAQPLLDKAVDVDVELDDELVLELELKPGLELFSAGATTTSVGGPQEGGIATQPLHSRGSPTPSAGTKSEVWESVSSTQGAAPKAKFPGWQFQPNSK